VTFSDFDDAAESSRAPIRGRRLTPETFTGVDMLALPSPRIPCGFFALTLSDDSVRHFRIRLEKGGIFAGKRTFARLTGPTLDTNEWENVALVSAEGFAIFKRWRNDRVAGWAVKLWSLLMGESVEGYRVERDVRCRWCLRKLKAHDAIELQLGRNCSKRLKLVEPKRKRGKL
jgi:hypothetical protein